MRGQQGASMLEVVVAVSLGSIIMAYVGLSVPNLVKGEAQTKVDSVIAGGGWQVQHYVAPFVGAVPPQGVMLNYLSRPTADNIRLRYKTFDGKMQHTLEVYQDGSLLVARWIDTTLATGDSKTQLKLLAYDLAESEGVNFEWGPLAGQVVLTLKWQGGFGQQQSRSWTFYTL